MNKIVENRADVDIHTLECLHDSQFRSLCGCRPHISDLNLITYFNRVKHMITYVRPAPTLKHARMRDFNQAIHFDSPR